MNELTAEQQEWIRQLKRTDHEARQKARADINISQEGFVSVENSFKRQGEPVQ
jgi:hypothetical protein